MQTQLAPLKLSNQLFEQYARMRRESPVFYNAEQQCWAVYGYDDVRNVFANWQLFSSKVPHPPEQTDFTQSLNFTDPPKHRSLRSLVAKVFTSRRVEELAPRMIEITNELIDRVKDQGQMDFIHDFAIPLPVIVIAEILGVPVERRADFKHWSDGIMESNQAAYRAMGDYFRELIQQRVGKPGHDLVSDLIAVHEGSETLSAQELVDFCMVLLVAGNETTTNLLANTIVCLHEFPEAYDRLRNEPELLNLAIEETLRYRSPAQILPRYTKVETQIGGQTIPAGQLVLVNVGSANRDETKFDRADQYVIDRDPNEHLAFGNGIHFCLGAPLARLEAEIGLRAILERLPNLRIDPTATLELVPVPDVHGFKSLPVLF
ncbi:MAG: cytochrome P450 [Leptolyngbyaceae cyanobacterium bins.302]|nr:cytochrome P450 [Leptolyngbyaceae cyanobacterium bins.302]